MSRGRIFREPCGPDVAEPVAGGRKRVQFGGCSSGRCPRLRAMSASKSPPTFRGSLNTVRHSLDGAWSQAELGEAFDVTTLSVIGELDPTGANGVVREVLAMFRDSLEPTLESIEVDLRHPGGPQRLLFAAHKLKSAAGQIGALRLAAACEAVEAHLTLKPPHQGTLSVELRGLVDNEMVEIIRVQRRLRTLLG